VLEDADQELEEAASSLGASRWQIFSRVIFPMVRPALLTGFALAFARALGEYGSVIFIAGNLPPAAARNQCSATALPPVYGACLTNTHATKAHATNADAKDPTLVGWGLTGL